MGATIGAIVGAYNRLLDNVQNSVKTVSGFDINVRRYKLPAGDFPDDDPVEAAVNAAVQIEVVLTLKNIMVGLLTSTIIGIIAGIFPAYSASRLDPVEAIRSN